MVRFFFLKRDYASCRKYIIEYDILVFIIYIKYFDKGI